MDNDDIKQALSRQVMELLHQHGPFEVILKLETRVVDLTRALDDCLSTYRDDDLAVNVSAERIEAWQAILKAPVQ